MKFGPKETFMIEVTLGRIRAHLRENRERSGVCPGADPFGLAQSA